MSTPTYNDLQYQHDLHHVERVVRAEELTLALLDRFVFARVGDVAAGTMAWQPRDRSMFHLERSIARADGDYLEHSRIDFDQPGSPPPWLIAFTTQFQKDIARIDRKQQGHILETLQKLSGLSWPFQPMGDTFKPLGGELKGLWRYRLGDFRLVVKPRKEKRELDVLTYAARDSVYD